MIQIAFVVTGLLMMVSSVAIRVAEIRAGYVPVEASLFGMIIPMDGGLLAASLFCIGLGIDPSRIADRVRLWIALWKMLRAAKDGDK